MQISVLLLAAAVVKAAGPWEMAQAVAPDEWMPAVVPGTVLTTLVRNGKVPDPYRGLNNKLEEGLIPDLAKNRAFYEATFRSEVEIPAAFSNRVSVVSDISAAKHLTARAEVYDFDSRKVWENEVKVKVEGEECTS